MICTHWPKLPICKAFWLRYQGTPWAKVLAPLANAKPDRGLTAQAEPLMQEYRHRALVAMAPKPAKQGERPACGS